MSEPNSSRLAAKANDLYWHTSRPAGRLADELEISRSKFYALIEPLRLDQSCPECGAPLTFNSRTDREAGRGRCSQCGEVADVAPEALEEPAGPTGGPGAAPPAPLDTYGARELWLTALVGVAAGLAITAWLRRR